VPPPYTFYALLENSSVPLLPDVLDDVKQPPAAGTLDLLVSTNKHGIPPVVNGSMRPRR
jgi:hypothetical protein